MSNADRTPTAYLVTLGCKVNQCDTEALAEGLRAAGWRVLFSIEEKAPDPDVIVVNSCAVTTRSEAKSRQAARRLMRRHPRSRVVLAGCYPQIAPEAVQAIEGLAGVAGTDRVSTIRMLTELASTAGDGPRAAGPAAVPGRPPLPAHFEDLPVSAHPGRVRAFLKVQEGCPGGCTYCVVPLARGLPRSRPLSAALDQAARLVGGGAREIVLTGIQLGLYGRDLGGVDLADLVLSCLSLPGLVRLRLSSLEPGDVSERLLSALSSSPKACPHLHIPLQSGSDAVLRRMGRPYGTDEYREMAESARRLLPGIALSTDVIAGFPGETGNEFEETAGFIREIGFMRLHVFPFSRRPGTIAAELPDQLPGRVREERSRALIEVGQDLAHAFNRGFVGQEVEVLLEHDSLPAGGPTPGGRAEQTFLSSGLTGHYVRAEVASDGGPLRGGDLVVARARSAGPAGIRCLAGAAGGS